MRATVIGRGPSGLLAATLLARDGARVRILSEGEGSLALWSGDFSFGSSTKDWANFPIERPTDAWWAWLEEFVALLADIGVPMAPLPDRAAREASFPRTLTPIGHLRPTLVRPSWQFAITRARTLCLIDFEGLPDAVGPAQAAAYQRATTQDAAVVGLPRPPVWDETWGALRYASWLDRDQGQAWLVRELTRVARDLPTDADVCVPGVCGLEHTDTILARAAEALGRPVTERPIVTPSVQGIRLRDRWEGYLRALGVVFETGRAVRLGRGELELADGRRWQDDLVVVATGGVLGGGALVLPSGVVLDPLTQEELGRYRHPDDLDSIGRPGIALDDGVVAVGRAVAGWNPNRDHNGGAMVLATVHEAIARAKGATR